jgi:hypothetical protein
VPANAVALVMRAEPGFELGCKARNHLFPEGHRLQPRGVISYYPARTMPTARTMAAWLAAINRLVQTDMHTGLLPPLYQPTLQVLGESMTHLPGLPADTPPP